MKLKILSLLATLLVSCQYSPVYANITDNSSVYLGNKGTELTLCKDIAGFAYVSMKARQDGIAEEVQKDLAPVPTNQDEYQLRLLLDSIVNGAYIFPVYKDKQDKEEISLRFSEVIYHKCKGEK
jgi:hypothetical protein